MAYKSKGGCTPITAKIKHTTKGGITQPILNMGAPVKMKMSSPAKVTPSESRAQTNRKKAATRQANEDAKAKRQNELDKAKPLSEYLPTTRKAVEKRMKAFDAKYGTKKSSTAPDAPIVTTSKSSGESMTPYSVKDGKGIIHGPKVSYDMAYEKAKKTKRYADMSKDDYIKEAKKQTKSFLETGNWDANPKRKKAAAVSTIKSTGIKPLSVETKLTGEIDASAIKPKASEVTNKKAAKKATNKTTRAARVRQKGIEALESGNLTKARRLKRREARINKRAEKQLD